MASDCIWIDPASEKEERRTVDEESGYGKSLRRKGAICFGHKAVADFLKQEGFSYIIRAHEAHAEGVSLSKDVRVLTVSFMFVKILYNLPTIFSMHHVVHSLISQVSLHQKTTTKAIMPWLDVCLLTAKKSLS